MGHQLGGVASRGTKGSIANTMHHYDFHIGDYMKATAHLSNEEDLCYRRLLDMYYDTELPIPLETDWVSRRLRIGIQVVSSVLSDFFIRKEDGWHSVRCDEEIAHYKLICERNRLSGKLGGRPKKTQMVSKRNRLESESNPNHEPVTSNQIDKSLLSDSAKTVLEHLNKKTGHSFRGSANLQKIADRLKDGATVDDCIRVIDCKVDEWSGDAKMSSYLRPETLFGKTKFWSYEGASVANQSDMGDLL